MIAFLFRFTKSFFIMKMPKWPIPYGTKDVNLGLERVNTLLSKLGNPHKKLPPVVHVAGTNGKGSTIAFMKAILENAGYKVHRYTSPHIVNFNERIQLAGKDISDAELDLFTHECKQAAEDIPVTFFEGTTAMAFLAFSKVEADVMLLETGMGGRLDATNVVDNPSLTVITPISMDHMEYLGDSLEKIATEKAGIIKPNSTCVISWQESGVKRILLEKCLKEGALPCIHGTNWDFTVEGDVLTLITKNEAIKLPKPNLEGVHQILNALTAAMSVKMLKNFSISNKNIAQGIQNARWQARMEKISYNHVLEVCNKNTEVWVDGAHNTSGAQFLATTILHKTDRKWIVINGRTANRNIPEYLECFRGISSHIYAVPVYSEPKGENPENIYKEAKSLGFKASQFDNLKDAIIDINNKYAGEKIGIIVCGSLYLAGDLANYFEGK